MRMSDWSSDVCSSDLAARRRAAGRQAAAGHARRNVVHRRFFGPVGPMRAIPPVWRVGRIATAVVAIGIPVPVAAVAVAVSDAQAATPIARVAIYAAVARTVTVFVIIYRQRSDGILDAAAP